jgi:hypothetical protein
LADENQNPAHKSVMHGESGSVKAGLNFTLEKQSSGSKARAAKFLTLHGKVETPIFRPRPDTRQFEGVWRTGSSGQYVSLAASSRNGRVKELRRRSQLHELAWTGAQ